jgi:hypothetical protein
MVSPVAGFSTYTYMNSVMMVKTRQTVPQTWRVDGTRNKRKLENKIEPTLYVFPDSALEIHSFPIIAPV